LFGGYSDPAALYQAYLEALYQGYGAYGSGYGADPGSGGLAAISYPGEFWSGTGSGEDPGSSGSGQ
jgi:hypothetical protein